MSTTHIPTPSAQAALEATIEMALARRPGLLHAAFCAVYPRREAECRAADDAEAAWDRDNLRAPAAHQIGAAS